MTRILVLCTGNRCRSQMAQGILQSLDPHLDGHSAGTKPASEVHPLGLKVMSEIGIDISTHYPKHIDRFIDQEWDLVITVCGGANGSCPMFSGKVGKRMHIGFDDPDAFTGTDEEIIAEFRRVRDEIRLKMQDFYLTEINRNNL